ncbi:hypothetical protein [Flavobacterium sp. F52]|uniref:hypothetical protein n=1 Tax=Flavobacterium sp. F52 TaxID=1202532 RepID=UPI000272DBF2|nr:hypothetical protein [Flavobacterium sp. F52]EJG03204.1 hypothetical protein FF52_03390 [Flavobacterium sp. F52]
MKNSHLKILEILNSESEFKLEDQNKASFILGKEDKKYIKGTMSIYGEHPFSLIVNDTNYKTPYLAKKIRNAAAELNLEFYKEQNKLSFFASLGPGDNIWVRSDGHGNLTIGQEVILRRGTAFYRIGAYPLLCNPVGSLKQNIPSIFNGYQSEKCDPTSVAKNYAIFQLQ